MILADIDIVRELNSGMLMIRPWVDEQLQPASYDVTLGMDFRVFRRGTHTHVDTAAIPTDLTEAVMSNGDGAFIIHPGELVLARTEEWFEFPALIAGRLEGKSSLGRIGLLTHATAGFFDPGFKGTGTLELGNISGLPIKLHAGMRIGQMSFIRMESRPNRLYGDPSLNSKYQGQLEPTASRYEP